MINSPTPKSTKLPVCILISGRGSNMQSIVDAVAHDNLPIEIRTIISDRPEAAGIKLAADNGITTQILNYKEYPDRESFDQELMRAIDESGARLIILAGFMRILTPAFTHHYTGRLLNIHPSLLPAFQGLNTHQRALDAKVNNHGASVHFVTEELDGGPVILQAEVPVRPGDDTDTLAARVLKQEHRIYPAVIRWFAEGRLRMENGKVLFDDRILAQPMTWDSRSEVA